MRSVIKSCETGQYCALESPTGTGKTLSLLCGVFSWLNYKESKSQFKTASKPRIVYSSRTHSQLSNVVGELKKTVFHPSLSIIASRSYLCLEERIRTLPNEQQSRICREMRQRKQCKYDNDNRIQACARSVIDKCFNIEEFVNYCAQNQACPYITSQINVKNAEFILTPYSYIVDPISRNSLPSSLFYNSVLIIDEAHNFPQQCCDYSSIDISFQKFGNAKYFFDRNEDKFIAELTNFGIESIIKVKTIIANMCTETSQLITNDKEIESFVKRGSGIMQEYCLKSAEFMYNLMDKCGLNEGNISLMMRLVQTILDNQQSLGVKSSEEDAFDLIKQFLSILFPAYKRNVAYINAYYTICVTHYRRITTIADLSFTFFCFTPGKAFNDIRNLNPLTIILTSGTLSPINSFISQFDCPFPIVLENNHIAKKEQLKIFIVSEGPTKENLSFTYAKRKEEKMQKELQDVLERIVKKTPKGALIFFPSFTFLNDCTPYLASIEHKKIIIEPHSSYKDSRTLIQNYKRAICDSNSQKSSASKKDGAALLAVCRGKISEGIDFSDDYARSVTVVGIPFPNIKDIKVILKKEWLEKKQRGLGQRWYLESAIRAVNQSIGRAIRHKDDYAIVFLIDSRYEGFASILPKWVQPSIYKCKTASPWKEIEESITPFFTAQKERMDEQARRFASVSSSSKSSESESRNGSQDSIPCAQRVETQETQKEVPKSKLGARAIKELPVNVQKEIASILGKFKRNHSVDELKQNIELLGDDKGKKILFEIMNDKLRNRLGGK